MIFSYVQLFALLNDVCENFVLGELFPYEPTIERC